MHVSKLSLSMLSLAAAKSNAFQSTAGGTRIATNTFLVPVHHVRGGATSAISASSIAATSNTATTVEDAASLEDISPSYKELTSKLKTVTQLRRASAVLDYDRMVLMPSSDDAAAARGAQQSALAAVIHEKATDLSIPKLIAEAEADIANASTETANAVSKFKDELRVLELTKQSFLKNARIPADLEAKRAALASSAYGTWVKARKASDFSIFAPVLKDCFDTAKEVARCHRGDDKSIPLYTQMLDEFEMGMQAERIDAIFAEIQEALVPLIAKVLKAQEAGIAPSTDALRGAFDIEQQKKMNEDIVTTMGFDMEHGRADVSIHPFTMSFGPSDVRITSRYSTEEWYQGMAASIHECGHGMYEQNVIDSCLDIDSYLSMGAHESQSLFWERHIGMSKEFCTWMFDKLPGSIRESHSPEDVYGAISAVSQTEIRVEADELTYPLHVILRYNIERDVVEGKMEVDDIPQKWNELMKSMLDVEITDDAKGCLQVSHFCLSLPFFVT
jgi:carboxypeptidase Taq